MVGPLEGGPFKTPRPAAYSGDDGEFAEAIESEIRSLIELHQAGDEEEFQSKH